MGLVLRLYNLMLVVESTVVIADLHLGFSVVGYSLPRGILAKMLKNEALAILSYLDGLPEYIDRIIILGDVKEAIGVSRGIQRRQIEFFFKKLIRRFSQIVVVRGNHDGRLSEALSGFGSVEIVDFFLDKFGGVNILMAHGHKRVPSSLFGDADIIFIGHIHPAISELSTKLWVISRIECRNPEGSYGWKKQVIVFPSANPKIVGTDVEAGSLVEFLERVLPRSACKIRLVDLDLRSCEGIMSLCYEL